MSIWTHVLGVIRYDSSVLNSWPKRYDQDEITDTEMQVVYQAYQSPLPRGSEGPLKIDMVLTHRGPTILVTGDLRDFGKAELQEILEWLNNSHKYVHNFAHKHKIMFFLRDCYIRCNVEGDDNFYIIEEEYVTDKENPHYEFKLITLENKEL